MEIVCRFKQRIAFVIGERGVPYLRAGALFGKPNKIQESKGKLNVMNSDDENAGFDYNANKDIRIDESIC